MAGNTKLFLSEKITGPTTTTIAEAIPITGSIVSSSVYFVDLNIKNHTHGLFQSCYDYPYLSSSANHIFDLTAGYSTASALDGIPSEISASKKNNLYNEMSQYLVGFAENTSIKRFDVDGDPSTAAKIDEIIVINLARLLTKDGIQRGTFELELGVSGSDVGYAGPMGERIKIQDLDAATEYFTDSERGPWAPLFANNSLGTMLDGEQWDPSAVNYTTSKSGSCGQIYYQAGVVILSASMFSSKAKGGLMSESIASIAGGSNAILWNSASTPHKAWSISGSLTSGSINDVVNGFRHRFFNMSFNNQTSLTSTLYECDIGTRDFNYSTNPTYLSGSQIIVKNNDPSTSTSPKTFITTVGLYNDNHELMAVAKLSKPIYKDNTTSLKITVRLDY